jgi:hypothetical protein
VVVRASSSSIDPWAADLPSGDGCRAYHPTVSFWNEVRAGARAAFTVQNAVTAAITVGVTLVLTPFIGVALSLPGWAWIPVGLGVLLISGAVVLKLRQPKLEPGGASIQASTLQEEVKAQLWGPKPGDLAGLTDEELRAEAGRLARELMKFRQEHAKALPPLEWVVVPGDQEKMEAFKAWREQDAINTYERVFQDRVSAVYQELVRRRGYGHPMMDGRYDNIQRAGEIDTVAHALEDVANPEPHRPGLRDD